MDLGISTSDNIKLNFDVKEFHIVKYFDGDKSYSFNNVQLNVLKLTGELKRIVGDFLPCYAPIILSGYEERVLKITTENNRKIGYTKSFRIDLLKAIEEKEIEINNSDFSEKNQIFEDFINDLLEFNVNFACGLITKSERKSSLIDSFQSFYTRIFKEEIQQREIEEKKLTDEDFFANRWKRRPDIINDITFVWSISTSQSSISWVNQFMLEGIKRGIDKKTNIGFFFSGIHISKKKYGDSNKCEVNLVVQISPKNYPMPPSNFNDLIFDVEFWEKNRENRTIEIKNLWQNTEFLECLNRVIESPTW